MKSWKSLWFWGLAAGFAAAVADVLLIAAVDPHVSRWVILQAMLFWTVAGWAVIASDSGLGRFPHAIVTTLALGSPWIVKEAFADRHYEFLVPLLVQNLVFAIWFGWVRGRARRGSASRAAQTTITV